MTKVLNDKIEKIDKGWWFIISLLVLFIVFLIWGISNICDPFYNECNEYSYKYICSKDIQQNLYVYTNYSFLCYESFSNPKYGSELTPKQIKILKQQIEIVEIINKKTNEDNKHE